MMVAGDSDHNTRGKKLKGEKIYFSSLFHKAPVHYGENEHTADTWQGWIARAIHTAVNQEAESVRNQGLDTVFKGPILRLISTN